MSPLAFITSTPKDQSACAKPVQNENDMSNNNFTDGTIRVTIPGDVDGDFKVYPRDLALLIASYGAPLGVRPFNPNCDVDGDGYVGPHDLAILISNYGKHYP